MDHLRQHRPVGQGGFHTASLQDQQRTLHYVYDCGAMPTYASRRDAEIDQYIGERGAASLLDFLFISHAHADHLNGVPRLLAARTGLKVDTIVMPLLPLADRLVAFARAAFADPRLAGNAFYRDFIIDPVAAVRRFGPARIVLVRPGQRGRNSPGAPGANGDPPDGNPDRPDALMARAGGHAPAWEVVGRGAAVAHTAANGPVAPVFELDDTLGFGMRDRHGRWWLLAPFVEPAVRANRSLFRSTLAGQLGISLAQLTGRLRTTAGLLNLLTNHVADLAAAYKVVDDDLNVTSLSLYSGPVALPAAPFGYLARFGKWQSGPSGDDRCAWLGTGDAALAATAYRRNFLDHYRLLLRNVQSFVLAHHGSERNFDPQLLVEIDPGLVIAQADKIGRWRHPGTGVVQATASSGRFVCVVTSSPDSSVTEHIAL